MRTEHITFGGYRQPVLLSDAMPENEIWLIDYRRGTDGVLRPQLVGKMTNVGTPEEK